VTTSAVTSIIPVRHVQVNLLPTRLRSPSVEEPLSKRFAGRFQGQFGRQTSSPEVGEVILQST
jgi:hypothetical protein